MKVQNMTSANGNKVANQFIIHEATPLLPDWSGKPTNKLTGMMFQSYNTTIAFKSYDGTRTILDTYKWDYSRTTSKYRNQFLGETTKETQAKIDSGEYILADLNA